MSTLQIDVINGVYQSIGQNLRSFQTKDELYSDVCFVCLKVFRSFDPNKGHLFNYLHKSCTNFLRLKKKRTAFLRSSEVQAGLLKANPLDRTFEESDWQ